MKWWKYEFHIFGLQDEENDNNVEKIIAVKYATYSIQLQKDSRKKFRLRLVRNQTLTSAILVQRSNQLS